MSTSLECYHLHLRPHTKGTCQLLKQSGKLERATSESTVDYFDILLHANPSVYHVQISTRCRQAHGSKIQLQDIFEETLTIIISTVVITISDSSRRCRRR
jgi:hypothetical protein